MPIQKKYIKVAVASVVIIGLAIGLSVGIIQPSSRTAVSSSATGNHEALADYAEACDEEGATAAAPLGMSDAVIIATGKSGKSGRRSSNDGIIRRRLLVPGIEYYYHDTNARPRGATKRQIFLRDLEMSTNAAKSSKSITSPAATVASGSIVPSGSKSSKKRCPDVHLINDICSTSSTGKSKSSKSFSAITTEGSMSFSLPRCPTGKSGKSGRGNARSSSGPMTTRSGSKSNKASSMSDYYYVVGVDCQTPSPTICNESSSNNVPEEEVVADLTLAPTTSVSTVDTILSEGTVVVQPTLSPTSEDILRGDGAVVFPTMAPSEDIAEDDTDALRPTLAPTFEGTDGCTPTVSTEVTGPPTMPYRANV